MKKYIAEYLATFALIICGTGAVVVSQEIPSFGFNGGVALAFGLIVTLMIYVFGDISGANMNPVVSITLACLKMHTFTDAFFYTLFQAAGAFSASFTLHFLFPANKGLGGTLPSGTAMQSFLLETFLTFLLMLAVLLLSHTSHNIKKYAAIIIGAIVGLEAYFAGPICGASMNPIRSIAPAIVSHQTQHLWVYIAGPSLGAYFATVIWLLVFNRKTNQLKPV